jgi:hypothetical protein
MPKARHLPESKSLTYILNVLLMRVEACVEIPAGRSVVQE